eukprot:242407_1
MSRLLALFSIAKNSVPINKIRCIQCTKFQRRYNRCTVISNIHSILRKRYNASQCLMSQQQKLFCTQSVKPKRSRIVRIFLIGIIGSCFISGYFFYTLYSDLSSSHQEQTVFSQYTLNKLFENEQTHEYFFGDDTKCSDEESKQRELETSNSKAATECSFDVMSLSTVKVLKMESDIKSNTGISAHVTAAFKPLDPKIWKILLDAFELDENEKDEYQVLGRAVSIDLQVDYKKTEQEDGRTTTTTTNETYTEWSILDDQIVLFDIKNVQWEDRLYLPKDDENDV